MTSVQPARPCLTSNDASVLQALFDAESSPSSGITVDPLLPSWPTKVNVSSTDLEALKRRETDIVRKLQTNETPSRENVQSALDELDSLVSKYPTYPSAYINRAQALRILVDIQYNEHLKNTLNNPYGFEINADDALFAPEAASLSSQIFADLGQAISLATPDSPADPLSSVQARLLSDAHTHRGYLLLKSARVKKVQAGQENVGGPESLRGLSADRLEEMASHDFFLGGRYGNKVAQQLAVQTNPYAKMCGAIVKEAMKKEVEG